MRLMCLMLIGGLVLTGCATSKSPTASAKKSSPATAQTGEQTSAQAASPAKSGAASLSVTNGASVVTLVDSMAGKVASVNAPLRFVVLDFSLSRVPAIGQQLGVYRNGVKVGDVKVTGPSYYNNIVADVVAGELKANDEVR